MPGLRILIGYNRLFSFQATLKLTSTMKILPFIRTEIVSKNVTDIVFDEDGLSISLSNEWNINVWSAVTLYLHGEKIDLCRISELIGASLMDFIGDDVHERLIFSNGFEVIVELDARKSFQAEAMMVRGPKNLIVVWND